ncbi:MULTISPECIES: type II toxin-antitoxin system HipA family toxin [unclassified Phenylobacterium]|uniref:type II toxin-antitoxin system HipA family toxin n=1 Tax=unclassified Phenylobacterium TaxID=2640670 RepID=UPI00083AAC22|nr:MULTISPECIES: HipA domain-containing protein [unclassified Phenylobacterium]
MNRSIGIFLGDNARPVGVLRYDQQGARESAAFEYTAEWLQAVDGFDLEPGLRRVTGPQFHRKAKDGSVFHGALADTEPDGWGKRVIRRDHAKRRQAQIDAGEKVEPRPLNSLDFLLAVDDVSRVGALRLRDENGTFQRAPEDGKRTTPPLIELAQLLAATRAVETNQDTVADLAYLRGRGTSLGGLRPKCTVRDADGTLCIGKFPSVQDGHTVTKGEVLALHLARRAGIDAADARIVMSDDAPVALIRRFDRPPGGGRLMYVSAATMLGAETADDHAYTEIVDALRQHGARPEADAEELWRRIVFSVLISNVDDHLMNHGFLHEDQGRWRLSPAFDINPFPDRARELKTWVSEDTGPEATVRAAMSVLPYFRIPAERGRTILGEVEAAVAGWRETARNLGLTKDELDGLAAAFEHEEREAARQAL